MRVVALAGGTGSAKLLRGLAAEEKGLTVVANTGDNFWAYGLYVCPDVDIATYTLAGIADVDKGWGIAGDTFETLKALASLGLETWFNVGDRDFATHLARSRMLSEGLRLTEVTRQISNKLGVKERILPATDDHVETRILTDGGDLHLQEYWVRDRGTAVVRGVRYAGTDKTKATREVESAIASADRIIFCPANPVTSIGPILAVPGVRRSIAKSRAKKVALSPMVGRNPFSGPAGAMMKASGVEPSSVGVASLYRGLVDLVIIDRRDRGMATEVRKTGAECILEDTEMRARAGERRLARAVLEA